MEEAAALQGQGVSNPTARPPPCQSCLEQLTRRPAGAEANTTGTRKGGTERPHPAGRVGRSGVEGGRAIWHRGLEAHTRQRADGGLHGVRLADHLLFEDGLDEGAELSGVVRVGHGEDAGVEKAPLAVARTVER